jgi:signal transduction histidine kinase
MLASCQGHRHQAALPGAAWRGAVMCLGLGAAGHANAAVGVNAAASANASANAGSGWWLFVSLALLLVAALAYAVGVLRERALGRRVLQALRAQLRSQAQLQDAHSWRSDTSHRVVHWQAPGQEAQADSFALAQFAPALPAKLRAQQSFEGLQERVVQGWQGAQLWQLRGVPQLGSEGEFQGFVGTARPLDEIHQLSLQTQAMQAALRSHDGAAVVALDDGGGWRVQAFNAAALRLWPTLKLGTEWGSFLPMLTVEVPAQLLSDLETVLTGSAPQGPLADHTRAEAAGWRFEAFGPTPLGGRGLWLAQRNLVQAEAAGAAGGATHESDTFSFTVSHDLRAPIRVVEGFTRIVKEDYGKLLDRVGNDHLDRVLGAASRMNLMIDALLTLARLSTQPLAQQPVNLSQLAAYIMDDLRRGAPERQADVEIEPALQAHGDPTLLRLVLENLLGNAWKYSARCHRTQISLRTVPHNGPAGSNAGRAFEVRDNGAGFDMRSADRLFGLFQRLHSSSDFAGHGVGLASVRRIVKRHGGDIWAEAEVGRGAAFYFTLAG